MSEKKVAVVTGGATGIGAACVRELAAEGFRVGIHYRSSGDAAARLLAETGLEPEELRRRVASKGGTTAAALEVLEAGRVKEIFVKAIRAAQQRSRELSEGMVDG